ncbi:phosphatase PAP2 family protein [Georgenia sp. M64]|uniref:acid phosphatase n=1 Tax=Georgenia sp. M64 TaxID=3120520 RepID=UPI0030E076B1
MPKKPLVAGALACALAGGLASAAVAAPAADVSVRQPAWKQEFSPEPFSADVLAATYPSDSSYDYIPLLRGFTDLRENHPEILELNLATTVEINSGADVEQQERAIVDPYADMSVSMADGLGETLGQIYLDALAEDRLPKTEALISKTGQRLAGPSASTNPAKNFYDYDRPYVAHPELITYYDKEGGDAYGSTGGACPSGHTSQAFWQGTALATLLPELAPQILARTSEAGHNRVVMGVHYPLDVIGGRMMGQKIVERRWSDEEFHPLLEAASEELHAVLESDCGVPLTACVARDEDYLDDGEAVDLYEDRMTYGFPQVEEPGREMSVPEGADSLLIASHPNLTAEQRRQVLELTSIDSGYPLDLTDEGDDSWQRLNLAAAMAADVRSTPDGDVALIAADR